LAFPIEAEDQIRRNVLNICEDHIRKVLDSVRELAQMVDSLSNKADVEIMENHLFQIRKLKEEATESKRSLLTELADTGMLLMNREDFMRLAVQINEIPDYSEGAAYRINYMVEKKLTMSQDLYDSLMNLAKNVLKTVTNLRKTILSLRYSRSKAIEMSQSVDIAEYVVDKIFRETEMKIIDAELDVRTILILRDLAQFLEDIADKAEDAIDSTRVLALGV
jgi:predicted phosphate transport protein (TIGR00153 family)